MHSAAVLRLTGLFDRPMAKSCLQALRAEPAIAGLTDALVKLTPQQWNIAVKRLSEVELRSAILLVRRKNFEGWVTTTSTSWPPLIRLAR